MWFDLGAFVDVSGAFALQWTSSTTIPNGKIVDVCVGDNISFQWTFNTTSSEHVSDIEWYMLSEGMYVIRQYLCYQAEFMKKQYKKKQHICLSDSMYIIRR